MRQTARSLVTAGLFLLLPVAAQAAPFFSEIMFDPAGTDTGLEYVELHNPDATDVDVGGWTLTLRETTGASPASRTVMFATGTIIPAGGFLVAASSANLGGTASCNVAAATFGSNFAVYNASAPTVELFNGPTLVDAVLYRGAGFPAAASGRSLSVINLAMGNDDPANWRNSDCRYNAAPDYGTPHAADQTCADADIPALACIVPPDAGQPMDAGGGDSGVVDLDAGATDAAPPVDTNVFFSEIFFDAPGTSDSNLEWLELYNPTTSDVDLTGHMIRTSAATNPTTTLGAGAVVPAMGYLVLAQTGDLGGTLPCDVFRVDLGTVPTLGNSSGDFVELVTPGNTVLDRVNYIGGGFIRPPGGSSLSVANVAGGNNAANLWVTSDCPFGERDYNGLGRVRSFGTPGQPHQVCGAMPDGGVTLMCLPTPDGGPVDAGSRDAAPRADAALLLEPRDASMGGSNAPPTVTVSDPAAQTSSSMVSINWTATDPDGDTLTVSVLKAAMGTSTSGDEVLTGLGATGPATWDTTGVTPGTYRVLVRVDDGQGHVVLAEAPGRVVVGGGTTPLSIESPRGGETTNLELNIRVRTTATEGMVGIFYDTDSAGLDGTAIAGGIRPRGGNIDVVWNVANVADGEYFIYAVLEGAGGTASAYSAGSVTVARARRCGCSSGGQDGPPVAAMMVAMVVVAWFKGRGARARRAPGA